MERERGTEYLLEERGKKLWQVLRDLHILHRIESQKEKQKKPLQGMGKKLIIVLLQVQRKEQTFHCSAIRSCQTMAGKKEILRCNDDGSFFLPLILYSIVVTTSIIFCMTMTLL